MIEDVEIATRFFRAQFNLQSEFVVSGANDAYTWASAISETLPNIELLSQSNVPIIKWSEVVNQERELWPIQYLLPGGAYLH
jgi:hypothetical protein